MIIAMKVQAGSPTYFCWCRRILQGGSIAKRKEIGDTIRGLENTTHMKLLYERYIELKQWDVIAREMGLNSRWIFETHNRALEKVYEKIKLVI